MLLQRKPTQLFERQVHENADALVEHAHAVVEGKRLLGIVAFRLGGVWHAPMRRHWLARPDGTDFVRGIVTDREHEVELRRIGFRELIPRFRAQARDVVMHLAQQIERERINRAGRLAAGAIGAKFSSPFWISLGYDRARRVASAEEQYVQGFDGALGLHEVSSSFVPCSLRSGGLDEQYSVTIDRNSDWSPRQTN